MTNPLTCRDCGVSFPVGSACSICGSGGVLTDAQLFAAAGRALFGDNWGQATARLLGWKLDAKGQNRTLQRIQAAAKAGLPYDRDLSADLLGDLYTALAARTAETDRVMDQICQHCRANGYSDRPPI